MTMRLEVEGLPRGATTKQAFAFSQAVQSDTALLEANIHAERAKGKLEAAQTIHRIRTSKMTPRIKILTLQTEVVAAQCEANRLQAQWKADLIRSGVDVAAIFDRTMLSLPLVLYMDSY